MRELGVSVVGMSGTGLVSTAIKSLDQVDNGCGVAISHIAWKFYFPQITLVYESHFKGGVQVTPWGHVERAERAGKINRIVEWDMGASPFQVMALWKACEEVHADGYDVRRILSYYIWIKRHHKAGTKLAQAQNPRKFTCNELEVHTGKQVFDLFKDMDFSYTPNRITKFLNKEIPFARVS